MKIIGIDPGLNTGCAIFKDHKLIELLTFTPLTLLRYLENINELTLLAIEDSRLQQAVFSGDGHGRAKALKIARDIGRIDGLCAMVQEICTDRGIQIVQISPKSKGTKLSHQDFLIKCPEWKGKTNQHVRDAFSVGWMFRHHMNGRDSA